MSQAKETCERALILGSKRGEVSSLSSFRTLSKYRCANKKLEEVQRLRDRYVAVLEELHGRALFYAAENDRLSREAAEAAERQRVAARAEDERRRLLSESS